MAEWLETGGNLRVQHNPSLYPAGVGIALDVKDDGSYIEGEVVEPTAKLLVEKGVLRSFSIGISHPRVVKDAKAPGGRIVGGSIVEVSLVDRPANPSAKFALAKGATGAEWVGEIEEIDDEVAKSVAAEIEKSELTADDRNALDDSDFAYIDSEGGRHLPINDEAHVRAALSRFNQTDFENAAVKKAAAKKVLSAAKKLDIDVADDSAVAEAAKNTTSELDKLSEAIEVIKGSRVFYTNEHRENINKAMADLHDSLAKAFPGVCEGMSKAEDAELEKSDDKEDDEDTDQDTDESDDDAKDDGADSGDDKDSDEDDKDEEKSVEPEETKSKDAEPETAAEEAAEPSVTEVHDEVKSALAEIKKLRKQNKKLQKMYDELASEPDPAKAPVRGTRVLVKTAKVETPEAPKSAEDPERTETVAWLRSLATSGNPKYASLAQSQLDEMGEDYF